jgi:hypothetical protein
MNKRLPPEAFDVYAALGPGRSYQAVADHFRVSKRCVTRTAVHEDWSSRIGRIERNAQEQADKALEESLSDIRIRHQKALRVVYGRALEGLRDHRFASAMEATRALELAIKYERLSHGVAEGDSWDIQERARELRTQLQIAMATVPGPPGTDGADEREGSLA